MIKIELDKKNIKKILEKVEKEEILLYEETYNYCFDTTTAMFLYSNDMIQKDHENILLHDSNWKLVNNIKTISLIEKGTNIFTPVFCSKFIK